MSVFGHWPLIWRWAVTLFAVVMLLVWWRTRGGWYVLRFLAFAMVVNCAILVGWRLLGGVRAEPPWWVFMVVGGTAVIWLTDRGGKPSVGDGEGEGGKPFER